MLVDERNECGVPLTKAEITVAVIGMAKEKSPGIDGITYEFYQQVIELIGDDLVEVYEDSFNSNSLTKFQMSGIITLLYKAGLRD